LSDVLILNADAQPLSYLPLSAIQWKEAITYLWLDKVVVLDWYDDWIVRSASWETKVPAVMMLKEHQRNRRKPRFGKTNLYIRDLYTCQYCEATHVKKELTLDHVLPLSRGGKTNWENIVAACKTCNNRKGDATTMKPRRVPYAPDYYDLVNKRKQMDVAVKHPSWQAYL
jgi:5-methylcytosine-specific restriction endonuclease McrA